jgi:hypothetical protein
MSDGHGLVPIVFLGLERSQGQREDRRVDSREPLSRCVTGARPRDATQSERNHGREVGDETCSESEKLQANEIESVETESSQLMTLNSLMSWKKSEVAR